jgi:hypothetical protein
MDNPINEEWVDWRIEREVGWRIATNEEWVQDCIQQLGPLSPGTALEMGAEQIENREECMLKLAKSYARCSSPDEHH